MDGRRPSPNDDVAPRMWAGLAVVAAPSFVVSLDAMALYVAFGDWLPFVLLSGIGVSMVLPQLGWR